MSLFSSIKGAATKVGASVKASAKESYTEWSTERKATREERKAFRKEQAQATKQARMEERKLNAVQAREARAFATKHRLRTGSGRVYLDSEHYVEGDLRDPAFRAAVEKIVASRPREVKKVERKQQQPGGFGTMGGAGGVPPFLQGFSGAGQAQPKHKGSDSAVMPPFLQGFTGPKKKR